MILKTLLNKKDNINSLFDKRGQTLYTTIYNTYIIYNNIQYIHYNYIQQYTYIIWYIDIIKIYKGYTISNNILLTIYFLTNFNSLKI